MKQFTIATVRELIRQTLTGEYDEELNKLIIPNSLIPKTASFLVFLLTVVTHPKGYFERSMSFRAILEALGRLSRRFPGEVDSQEMQVLINQAADFYQKYKIGQDLEEVIRQWYILPKEDLRFSPEGLEALAQVLKIDLAKGPQVSRQKSRFVFRSCSIKDARQLLHDFLKSEAYEYGGRGRVAWDLDTACLLIFILTKIHHPQKWSEIKISADRVIQAVLYFSQGTGQNISMMPLILSAEYFLRTWYQRDESERCWNLLQEHFNRIEHWDSPEAHFLEKLANRFGRTFDTGGLCCKYRRPE